jgi:hypothetical protein
VSRVTNEFGSLLAARDDERKAAFGGLQSPPKTEAEYRHRLNVVHTGLTRTTWIRSAFEEALRDREIDIVLGSSLGYTGEAGRVLWLKIDPKIDLNEAVPWSPQRVFGHCRLFSTFNSKMACPSFALPAGGTSTGGTCPGADAGQTNASASPKMLATVEDRIGREVDLAMTICGSCYAQEGNFQYSDIQGSEVVRYWWIAAMLRAKRTDELVETLVRGLDVMKVKDWKKEMHPELSEPMHFFRLHDSGDFFSVPYIKVWQEVARRQPDVLFWAPTRTWVVHQPAVFAGSPPNLIIRPSGYHFDDPAPSVPHMAAGSTSLFAKDHNTPPHDGKKAKWDCRAYYVGLDANGKEIDHSCTEAARPGGGEGCRMCWLLPKMTVQYTAH